MGATCSHPPPPLVSISGPYPKIQVPAGSALCVQPPINGRHSRSYASSHTPAHVSYPTLYPRQYRGCGRRHPSPSLGSSDTANEIFDRGRNVRRKRRDPVGKGYPRLPESVRSDSPSSCMESEGVLNPARRGMRGGGRIPRWRVGGGTGGMVSGDNGRRQFGEYGEYGRRSGSTPLPMDRGYVSHPEGNPLGGPTGVGIGMAQMPHDMGMGLNGEAVNGIMGQPGAGIAANPNMYPYGYQQQPAVVPGTVPLQPRPQSLVQTPPAPRPGRATTQSRGKIPAGLYVPTRSNTEPAPASKRSCKIQDYRPNERLDDSDEWQKGDPFLDACICTTNCNCRKGHRVQYRERMVNGETAQGEIRYHLKDEVGRDCGDHSNCIRKSGTGNEKEGMENECRAARREAREGMERLDERLGDLAEKMGSMNMDAGARVGGIIPGQGARMASNAIPGTMGMGRRQGDGFDFPGYGAGIGMDSDIGITDGLQHHLGPAQIQGMNMSGRMPLMRGPMTGREMNPRMMQQQMMQKPMSKLDGRGFPPAMGMGMGMDELGFLNGDFGNMQSPELGIGTDPRNGRQGMLPGRMTEHRRRCDSGYRLPLDMDMNRRGQPMGRRGARHSLEPPPERRRRAHPEFPDEQMEMRGGRGHSDVDDDDWETMGLDDGEFDEDEEPRRREPLRGRNGRSGGGGGGRSGVPHKRPPVRGRHQAHVANEEDEDI